MFKIETRRVRGGPIFIERRGETVSLVPEVRVQELVANTVPARRFKLAQVQRVFLIDKDGVRPMRVRRRVSGRLLVAATLLVCSIVFVVTGLLRRRTYRD